MTTAFQITFRPILILCKCIGLIHISFTVEPTGFLVQSRTLTFDVFLEIARMVVLLIFTYLYVHQFKQDWFVLQILHIFKFWIIIIAARLSTKWIIRFINGIIEFDRKTIPLSTNLVTPQRSWTKKHWNTIFISLFGYFIGLKILYYYCLPIHLENIVVLTTHAIFSIPFVMDYAVTVSSCFFLQNLYVRFQMLNDIWNCLPADLEATSGQWTHIKIVDLMENTRLLHSELCDLLKMFTLGYGPLLLGLFTTSYINLIIGFYFIVNSEVFPNFHSTKSNWVRLLPLIVHVQIVTFLMSIIVFVSSINEKRLKMISYLRLYRISNLHLDKKRQIKMFLNQISVCDSDQISAFGFFNINLNLVTSILVLLVSGIITLIQMKDHPMMLKLNNDTKSFLSQ
ncbi:uncharacterized protein LOC132933956, partial [Metopolophium dirhodum]|uniref:uncharacterized protein LOC132933956 n=1 Tax=Metopolophium dirhodum TaxID=44670 RepID=UPI00298FCA60